MPETHSFRFRETLRVLAEHKVRCLVVGGVCAALHGASTATLDLGVVHARDEENVQRLLAALQELEAHDRTVGARHITPNHSHLVSSGHVLDLETLIALKEEVGRDKDTVVLPTLRSTLEEKRRLTRS